MLDVNNITREIHEEKKVELPVYFPSPFNYSFTGTTRLAVILSREENFDWYYSNFLQIIFNKKLLDKELFKYTNINNHGLEVFPLNYYVSGKNATTLLLRETTLNDHICNINRDNALDYHLRWLDNRNYIFAHVEVTKLKGSKYYNLESHRIHTVFVFGYDLEKGIFKIFDFDKRGSFVIREIDIESYFEAFFSEYVPELLAKKKYGPTYNVVLCQHRECLVSYKINKEYIKCQIEDFLHSYPTDLKFNNFLSPMNVEWGINAYRSLIEYMKLASSLEIPLQFTSFHVLNEYTMGLCDRVKYYYQKGIITYDEQLNVCFDDLQKLGAKIRQLAFTYNMRCNQCMLEKMIAVVEQMSSKQEECFLKLLVALR